MEEDKRFVRRAVELALAGIDAGGGPFGSVVVKDGEIIGEGYNSVTSTNDPTAHAEVVAIREACRRLGTFQLDGCVIYTTCEPCPMCLGAIYWARAERIVMAAGREDAAAAGFDDDLIYRELDVPAERRSIPTSQICREDGIAVFKKWNETPDKVEY